MWLVCEASWSLARMDSPSSEFPGAVVGPGPETGPGLLSVTRLSVDCICGSYVLSDYAVLCLM